jgi:hypothetical protein
MARWHGDSHNNLHARTVPATEITLSFVVCMCTKGDRWLSSAMAGEEAPTMGGRLYG